MLFVELALETPVVGLEPGANPTTASYNASVHSIPPFLIPIIFICFKNAPS
jgi:hypothetical protein